MKIEIVIKRQNSANEESYYESFIYNDEGNISVADFLNQLNQDRNRRTIEGAATNAIVWECSCMEMKCGACAMRINGKPMLACTAFLPEVAKDGKITVEPLRKFPVISDLKVNRTSMLESLDHMQLWLQEKSNSSEEWNTELQYQSGQCLMCGCCLDVCPSYQDGGSFYGASTMVHAYKIMEQETNSTHLAAMKASYEENFHSKCNQCNNAFACEKICPLHLPIHEMQERLNG